MGEWREDVFFIIRDSTIVKPQWKKPINGKPYSIFAVSKIFEQDRRYKIQLEKIQIKIFEKMKDVGFKSYDDFENEAKKFICIEPILMNEKVKEIAKKTSFEFSLISKSRN